MKFALLDGGRAGVVVPGGVIDISEVFGDMGGLPPQLRVLKVIDAWNGLEPKIRTAVSRGNVLSLSEAGLCAPVPRPGKILCAVGNYKEGVTNYAGALNLFLKSPTSVIGPGEQIVLPAVEARAFHHEAELAVVIGRTARNISAEQALDFVFGYTCFIDVSARDVPVIGRGIGFIDKSFDTFGPMGPWIVTRDEIPNPQALRVRLWIDGELRQDYGTDDMDHPVRNLLSWASNVTTLEPGDVIACGTNHQGLGPLQDGERVVIEIDAIGRFEVHVKDPLRRTWPKGIEEAFAKKVRERRVAGAKAP
jgi:2-keto-4-pentenoate hydratase/2-oxohepta-3-ene-1,7-dioic acid hydratase in catechol pathway